MTTKFVWNELVTSDQDVSGDFFSRLFGWERKEIDMGSLGIYTLFQENGNDVAGMMNPVTEFSGSHPPFWSAYIEVEDIDACMQKVEELGGSVIAKPEDIPNVGRVCMISGPEGAPVCLITPIKDSNL